MNSRNEMYRSGLDYVLSPFSPETFLSSIFSQKFLYIPGQPDKFDGLLPWFAVNDILSHRCSPACLAIAKAGKVLPSESVFGRHYATTLTDHLREGATLIINGIDDKYEPISLLCKAIERTLSVTVLANMYAAWSTTQGFNLHRDGHDVLILQISGKKDWQVYGETDKHPTRSMRSDKPTTPIWEGRLCPGDTLYLPRGWWHVATPCDEPSLHLTVGMYNVTAIHLVRWLAERLERHECMRMDLPRFRDAATQAAHLSLIRQTIADECMSPNILEEFLNAQKREAIPRPAFGLPWSATSTILPEASDYIIDVVAPRGVRARSCGDDDVEVDFNLKELRFSEATSELFEYLDARAPISLGEFYSYWDGKYDTAQLKAFLTDLIKQGVIVVTEPEPEPESAPTAGAALEVCG